LREGKRLEAEHVAIPPHRLAHVIDEERRRGGAQRERARVHALPRGRTMDAIPNATMNAGIASRSGHATSAAKYPPLNASFVHACTVARAARTNAPMAVASAASAATERGPTRRRPRSTAIWARNARRLTPHASHREDRTNAAETSGPAIDEVAIPTIA